LNAQHLVLIGYRGTGKTTVAKRLAQRLGRTWVDADDQLEAVAGESIASIFQREGETAFRDRETETLRQLVATEPQVLALGGGVVGRDENRRVLTTAGHVIWLRASAETIHRRLEGDPQRTSQRPNLTGSGGFPEIVALLAQREPLYRQCAHGTVDTDDKAIDAIVEEILAQLPEATK